MKVICLTMAMVSVAYAAEMTSTVDEPVETPCRMLEGYCVEDVDDDVIVGIVDVKKFDTKERNGCGEEGDSCSMNRDCCDDVHQLSCDHDTGYCSIDRTFL